MGEAKLLAISWSQHNQVFLDGIWNLYLEKYKVDIEIHCQGHVIWAHQMVLALFCPLLKDSLPAVREGSDPPCLNLDYASPNGRDLQLLIEFIYRGKICVSDDRLDNLRDVAKTLGVNGLVCAIEKLRSRRLVGTPAQARPMRQAKKGARKRKGRPKKVAIDNDQPELVDETLATAAGSCSYFSEKAKTAKRRKKLQKYHEIAAESSERSDDDYSHWQFASAMMAAEDQLTTETCAKAEEEGQFEPCNDIPGKTESSSEGLREAPPSRRKANKRGSTSSTKAAPRFVCEVCSKAFKNRESFRRHVRRHGDPDALLKCTHCDFRTLQKSTWVQHMAVLHKVDPQGNRLTEDLKCPQCDYACVTKYQLKSHLVRKHTVDKPFKCTECDYATVTKSDIEKHVGIRHRHERLYMCETCGFRSQTQGGYNRHVRSHSGVKPFKCELCGQAYADSPKLKIHLQKHTSDEKPFVCHLCGHACRRMDNLQMHLKRIHKTCVTRQDTSRNTNYRTLTVAPESPSASVNASGATLPHNTHLKELDQALGLLDAIQRQESGEMEIATKAAAAGGQEVEDTSCATTNSITMIFCQSSMPIM